MKNSKLSERVTELRNRKGFSQEVLAEDSGLSLRTIQRIENGETTPRGDTLQRIAKGLGVTSEELIDWKLEKNDSYLAILNASALTFIFFPIFGIVVPLVMWISKKGSINKIDEISKEILNFQITWCIVVFILFFPYLWIFILEFTFPFGKLGSYFILFFILGIVFLYFFNIVLILMSSYRLRMGKNHFYFIFIPFLK